MSAHDMGQDLVERVKTILRGPEGDDYTDSGMEDAFFRWPVIARAIEQSIAALDRPATVEGEVMQADRDAAADLIEVYWAGASDNMRKLADSYRAGHSQGAFVRAFARHRLAHSAPKDVPEGMAK